MNRYFPRIGRPRIDKLKIYGPIVRVPFRPRLHQINTGRKEHGQEKGWLYLVFTLYAVLAFSYSLLMPLWEAPDETAHYLVVLYLAREGRMPTPAESYEAIQPPLYYWLAAKFFQQLDGINPRLIDPYRPALTPRSDFTRYAWTAENYRVIWGAYFLRWLSIPLGGLALAFIYKGARRFTAHLGRPGAVIALATVTLVGLTPQFLHNSSALSNDPAANAAGAGLFWLLSTVALEPPGGRRLLLITAAALAFPVLIKLTILPMSLTLLIATFWQLRHVRPARWPWLLAGGAGLGLLGIGGLVALAPGSAGFLWRTFWWRVSYVRPDLFEVWPLWEIVKFYSASYWGQVAWKTAGLPRIIVLVLAGLMALGWLASLRLLWPQTSLSQFWRRLALLLLLFLAVLGIASYFNAWWSISWTIIAFFVSITAVAWWQHHQLDPAPVLPVNRYAWGVVWLAAALALLIIVKNALTTPQYQGRFLFPSLGALTLLTTAGWYALLPPRAAVYLPHLILGIMLCLNLVLWLGTIIPIFYQPFLGS